MTDLEPTRLQIYVDGACKPKNPGGAPVWGCCFIRNGVPVDTMGGLAGAEASEKATNNVAEYAAVINALKEAKRRGWEKDDITVYTDSQLVQGQIEAGMKVEATHLITLNRKAVQLKSTFSSAKLVWILGEKNKVAHNA